VRTQNDLEGEVMMATTEECLKALERLTARISGMNADDRAAHLVDRTLSCEIPDLGVTFVTRLGPDGADPVREAREGDKPAQVRFTANSDVVVSISDDPGSFARAWLTGRLKVQGNVFDLLRLRKLM
jgi:SCP-2 sterol transfer family